MCKSCWAAHIRRMRAQQPRRKCVTKGCKHTAYGYHKKCVSCEFKGYPDRSRLNIAYKRKTMLYSLGLIPWHLPRKYDLNDPMERRRMMMACLRCIRAKRAGMRALQQEGYAPSFLS
jgi:hypothetical protein